MANYNVDFSKVWQNLMPPNKRLTKYLAWGKVLLYPLQWLHSRFFIDYKEGTIYLDWNNSTAYTKNTFVKYTDRGIYCCIENTTAGITPLNSNYWYKTQDSFIGLTERMKYNSQKMIFEYALNRWFGLSFVQPPSLSPIYITNNTLDLNNFLVSSNDEDSSYATLAGNFSLDFVGTTVTSYSQYSFTIYYPSSLPATLGITSTLLEKQIEELANKLKISGTLYNILSY
jgi:hypothetical protein